MIRVRVNSMGKARVAKSSNDVPEVPPVNPQGRWIRLAYTIAPFFIYLLAERISLPGIDATALEGAGGSPELSSIVALGITPWLTAALLVESAALIGPWWRHLRHGGEVGRAKLQRATNVLGLLIAVFQAYSMASVLQRSEFTLHPGVVAFLMMLVTLLGGTTLTKLLADLVSRRGLANGYIVFFAGGALLGIGRTILREQQVLEWMDFVRLGVKIIAGSVLTWFVLTRLQSTQRNVDSEKRGVDEPETTDTENPYAAPKEQGSSERTDAPSAEPVVQQLPTVASGLLPYSIVTTLVAAPAMFHDSIPGVQMVRAWLDSDRTSGLASLSLLFGCTWVCTRLFHQPRRVAKVYARIPKSKAPEARIAGEVQEASRHAFVQALFFLFGLLVIDLATRKGTKLALGMDNIALATVFIVDIVKEFRVVSARQDLVSVWPEHRPYALEAARKALAAEGILLHVRNECQRRLFQFTAPYVAMEMCVPHSDAQRAAKILQRVLLEKPAHAAEQFVQPQVVAKRRPLQAWVVVLIAAFSVGTVLLSWPVAKPAVARGPRTTKLEFVLIDDETVIADKRTQAEAEQAWRIRFQQEQVSVGVGKQAVRAYAVAEKRDDETIEAARQRLEAWIKTLTLPAGVRVGIGEYQFFDQELGKLVVTGWRTYLLKGNAILTEADVAHARVMPNSDRAMGGFHVLLEFTSNGAARFERATAENIKRRFAILLDGIVKSAPVIQTKIPGGIATITMGNADEKQQLEDAKNLEKALNGD